MRGYWSLASNPRFFALALASGIPFNGMFLYVMSAPVFLGEHLHLGPGEFFWFFVLTIAGIMGGAFLSGRMAGRIKPTRQIRYGFVIMGGISIVNLLLNLVFTPQAWWALFPIAIYSFGWALMVPVVTLLVLDLVPERRGMASSLQACVGSAANGFVAGVIAPLAMQSTVLLAVDVAAADEHRRLRLDLGPAAPPVPGAGRSPTGRCRARATIGAMIVFLVGLVLFLGVHSLSIVAPRWRGAPARAAAARGRGRVSIRSHPRSASSCSSSATVWRGARRSSSTRRRPPCAISPCW